MKRSTYSHKLADAAKDQRRKEGKARNDLWAGLTLEEKLVSLASRRGNSAKQSSQLVGRRVSNASEGLTLLRKLGRSI
jgi:hypothetical protein